MLFHCFNCCANKIGILLLSQMPVGQMDWQLADLRSRMRAVNVVKIDLPDDNLLFALLNKYFADRQMMAPPAMLSYLVKRMERSFTAVTKLATAVDHMSIAEKNLCQLRWRVMFLTIFHDHFKPANIVILFQ